MRINKALLPVLLFSALSGKAEETASKPNIIIILTDDQGYADLSCYGSQRVQTPSLDQMAKDGIRFTSFYAQNVCGPSRASLMSGCYPARVAEPGNKKYQHTQLHPKEVTLAEQLQQSGYETACIGKWHLGHKEDNSPTGWNLETMPNKQGFDYYYGTPLFNGFTVWVDGAKNGFRSQLLRNEEVVMDKVESWDFITERYTEEAINWIEANKAKPFFLYLSHNMPHIPLGAGPKFKGKNPGDPYADAVEEIDWSVGQILDYLKRSGLEENTIIAFLSDNGPWIEVTNGNKPGADKLIPPSHSGSATPLRGYKMVSWDGGHRVPCIIKWPKHIPEGHVVDEIATSMDFYPTFVDLAGGKLESGAKRDGINITELLKNPEEVHFPDRIYYYYVYKRLQAVRKGKWKLVLPRPAHPEGTGFCGRFYGNEVENIELYDLDNDVSESIDLAAEYPQVVKEMLVHINQARTDLGDYNQRGKGIRYFDTVSD